VEILAQKTRQPEFYSKVMLGARTGIRNKSGLTAALTAKKPRVD
jgi:hypothetical protein